MATKKGLIKGLVSVCAALGFLLGTKVASAADCHQVMVFKDGIQEYAGPNTSTGVVVRGSATVRVRLYCTNGKQSSVTSSDLPKKQDKAQVSEKKAGIEVILVSAFAEFEGTVNANPGETKNLTFTDGSGTTYTVTVQGKHGLVEQPALDAANARIDDKADKKDVEKKADKSYVDDENKKQDEEIGKKANKDEVGGSGDGRYRFWIAPEALFRPGFGPSGGVAVYGGIGFANPRNTIFELGLFGSYTFLGGDTDVRDVQGVPTTSPTAHQRVFTLGILPSARIPAGKIVEFTLGGGLGYQNLHIDEHTVGTIPATEQEWFWPSQDDHSLLLMANIGVSFKLSETPSPVAAINVGFIPAVQLIPTRKRMGGEEKTHKVDLPLMAGVGGEF